MDMWWVMFSKCFTLTDQPHFRFNGTALVSALQDSAFVSKHSTTESFTNRNGIKLTDK